MRGRSQHVRMMSGVEKGSVAMKEFRQVHPTSSELLINERLITAIKRLEVSVISHSVLIGANQIVGKSVMVGIKIFSIVEGLWLVSGRIRGCGRLLQVRLALCLLHRQKKQEAELVRLKNL